MVAAVSAERSLTAVLGHRLRQVVLISHELEPVVGCLTESFGLEVAYSDPGVAEFGLRNALLPVGTDFLEVLAPLDPGDRSTAGVRFLDRRGEGGYMLLVQVHSADEARRRAADLGLRVVWKADLPDIRGTHLHPADLGGTLLSVDEAVPAESWRWAGPSWRDHVRTGCVEGVAAAEIEVAEPEAVALRWSSLLGGLVFDQGEIRFRSGDRGLAAVDLIAGHPSRVGEEREICGVRFSLV